MATWAVSRAEVNGQTISYLRSGGDKPSCVLLHGLMGSGATWTPVARRLVTELDIVLPDARGHGGSSSPDGGYRYGDLAADASGLVEALRLSPTVLMGHSMGGLTAALTASRAGHLLRGLVLVDPTFLEPDRQQEVFESDVAEQHVRDVAQGRDALLADAFARHPHRPHELVEAQVDARLQTSAAAMDVLQPPNPPYRELVVGLDVPTLLLAGDRTIVTAAVAAELRVLNPRVQVAHLGDVGHGLPFDQPGPVATAVLDFVRDLPMVSRLRPTARAGARASSRPSSGAPPR